MRFASIHPSTKMMAMALMAASLFQLAGNFRQPQNSHKISDSVSTVVISAPIQILMYGGDRFLAANIEAIRVAAVGPTEEAALASYRIRSHKLVSQLNPCHEDNFYMANAMLSWGGSVEDGNAILERATECRYWDDIPPFFLGFNRYFFFQDIDKAREAIELAATRSKNNKTALQNISIVMESKKLNDVNMAAAYLRQQRDETKDQKLREMLNRRLMRLEGLITLRDAQKQFEQRYRRSLTDPEELISHKIIPHFPQDPLRIGYEFVNGSFRLRAMNVNGMEIRQ